MLRNNIKAIRNSKGISSPELAEMLHCSQSQIIKLENNKEGEINLKWVVRIAKALDCHPLDIIFDPSDLPDLVDRSNLIKSITLFEEQCLANKKTLSTASRAKGIATIYERLLEDKMLSREDLNAELSNIIKILSD